MALTQVLEYSNLMFTGLFVIEMAMKVIAEGPFGYIRSIYNLFDGFIVVLRCVLLDSDLLSPITYMLIAFIVMKLASTLYSNAVLVYTVVKTTNQIFYDFNKCYCH